MGFFQRFAAPSVAQPVKATVDTAHLSAASGAMLAHMTTPPNIFSSSINAGAPAAPQPASATAPSGFFAPRLDPLPASSQPASFPLPLVLGGAAALIAVGLVVYKLKKKKR